ncbi:hypothetical protein V5O48_011071 [Marasmius crinis-equi]|uniref:Uncharacterized protein n=1 Tax=Marasmius crinis-equi TaxID=585013 RepID=A0ABR3F6J9_9AGAR
MRYQIYRYPEQLSTFIHRTSLLSSSLFLCTPPLLAPDQDMTSHLRDVIKQAARAEQGPNPFFWTYVPPAPIERSFEEFTDALAQAYLVARYTPAPDSMSEAELTVFANRLGVRIVPRRPPLFDARRGNVDESYRMLLTSLVVWCEVWRDSLPEGTVPRKVYADIVRTIMANAAVLQSDDRDRRFHGEEVFPYQTSDWREVMRHNLAVTNWDWWNCDLVEVIRPGVGV